ncbi:MAG: GDSL-type esterase/lipase family protein, partial [Paracoccaceae bacterium]
MNNLRATLILSIFALAPGGPTTAEPVTIAALGDSLVQGYGLARDLGFVPQLQRWLDNQGLAVVVINAGVSGDTTAGGRARIGWTLGADIDALIVSLGANDALRGVDPAASKANLDAILATATARAVPVLLVGIQAPGNFGPE